MAMLAMNAVFSTTAAALPSGVYTAPEFFMIADDRRSFADAETRCRELGGQLASLHSDAEWAMVRELLWSQPDYTDWDYKAWIGASDSEANGAAEGEYVWTDGSSYEYTKWGGHEGKAVHEDCVTMGRYNKEGWQDFPCGRALPAVCRRADPVPATYTAELTFGDHPAYCVTSKDASIWDEPSYFELGFIAEKDECLALANGLGYAYVHYWAVDGRCRGLHSCPYEYDCTDEQREPCLEYETAGIGVRTYTLTSEYTKHSGACAVEVEDGTALHDQLGDDGYDKVLIAEGAVGSVYACQMACDGDCVAFQYMSDGHCVRFRAVDGYGVIAAGNGHHSATCYIATTAPTTATAPTTTETTITETTTTQLVDYAKLDRTAERLLAELMARFDGNDAGLEAVVRALAEAETAMLTAADGTNAQLKAIYEALFTQVGAGLDELARLIVAVPEQAGGAIAGTEARVVAAVGAALAELAELEHEHAAAFELGLAGLMEALGETHSEETELIVAVEGRLIAVMDQALGGLAGLEAELAAYSAGAAAGFADVDVQLAQSREIMSVMLEELHGSIGSSSHAVLARLKEASGELDKVAAAVMGATAHGFELVTAQMMRFAEQLEDAADELGSGQGLLLDTVDAAVGDAEANLAGRIADGFDHAETRIQNFHAANSADHDGLEAELDGLADGLNEARAELESNHQLSEEVLASVAELKRLIWTKPASKAEEDNLTAGASTGNGGSNDDDATSGTAAVTGAVIGVLAVGLIAAIVAVAVLKKRTENNADVREGGLPIGAPHGARAVTDLDDTYGNVPSVTAVVVHSDNDYSNVGDDAVPEGIYGLSNTGYDLGAGGFPDTSSTYDLDSSPTGTDYAMASASA